MQERKKGEEGARAREGRRGGCGKQARTKLARSQGEDTDGTIREDRRGREGGR